MAAILLGKPRLALACPMSGLGKPTTLAFRSCTYSFSRSLSGTSKSIAFSTALRSCPQNGLRSQRLRLCIRNGTGLHDNSVLRFLQTSRISSQQKESNKPSSMSPGKTPLTQRLLARTPIPHENIWTIPNILTFSRLFAAPVIGYLLLHDQNLYAFSLFVYAGITDLVDGYIARHWNQGTVVGTVIDPMADKTLMTITTVALALNGAMPLYLAVLILGRDVLLAISAIYYRYISLPPPKTFARYWDFSLPSAEVRPTGISKVNTALQLGLIGATMGMPLVELGVWAQTALTSMQYTVALTTVWSGASYIYSKDAVKILTQDEIAEKQEEIKQGKERKQ